MAFLLVLMLSVSACFGQRENLDYPQDITKIKEVELLRPDVKSDGKFAMVRDLNHDEIVHLLLILKQAKPIGPNKFVPDYYITFITTQNKNQRIKVRGNMVKGYESDYAYRVEGLIKF